MEKRFYLRNESGDFIEATESDYEEAFRERSDKIISKRLAISVKNALEKEKPEFLEKLRREETSTIRKEIEAEAQSKIDEAEKRVGDLENRLRRKTIAAEYGFKPEAEEFLGNGTEEEMRAKADTLKNSFAVGGGNYPEKHNVEPGSESLEKYGLDVKI